MVRLLKQGRSRWLFRAAILLLIGAAGLFWFSREQFLKRLTIENRSEQAITTLKISRGDESIRFENVKSGTDVNTPFRVVGGDHITIEGELADKSRVKFMGMAPERLDLVILKGGRVEPRQDQQR